MSRNGEKLEAEGDFVEALRKYRQAAQLFESVGKFNPDWKPAMVQNRIGLTENAIKKVQESASEQSAANADIVAELEGGVKIGGREGDAEGNLEIFDIDPLESRRLSQAENEVERLKGLLETAKAESGKAEQNAGSLNEVQRDNASKTAELKVAEDRLQKLRQQLAARPVEGEVRDLNQRIDRLEQEKTAMSMALRTSRGEHAEALSKIDILTADVDVMREQAKKIRQSQANVERDLKKERKISNEVVAGQREQLANLQLQLEEKGFELEKANRRIASLSKELEQSRDAYGALREEKNELLAEKEQMTALLRLNDSGRIEQLIQQNLGLSRELREANEKLQRLDKDNNATKDDVVDALRDLAIAKSRINRLHQENRNQEERIEDLNRKLKEEGDALASGEVRAEPEEVKILREVIRRQLRIQDRKKQAKDLLVEAARSLGSEDHRLQEAVNLFDAERLELSPEEQKLVADQQVDGEFISPFARDRETVGRATSALNQELESYDRAATKAYLSSRLLPARELYEMMVDQHPGHVPALCKLGVVLMKLGELENATGSFQKAIELDEGNPYAHRMLGYLAMNRGDLSQAEGYIEEAVELAPDDAASYLLLGMVTYQLGKIDDAESQFKASISVDPLPSEPYFNLALLYAKKGEVKRAREYYNQALERGALPDELLEKQIKATS